MGFRETMEEYRAREAAMTDEEKAARAAERARKEEEKRREWRENPKYGSVCKCGFPRRTDIGPCSCGDTSCSKTGPDGAVCDNPYHSQDI